MYSVPQQSLVQAIEKITIFTTFDLLNELSKQFPDGEMTIEKLEHELMQLPYLMNLGQTTVLTTDGEQLTVNRWSYPRSTSPYSPR